MTSSGGRPGPGGVETGDGFDTWPTGRLLSAAARLVEREWNAHLAQWDLNHASLGVLHVLSGAAATQRGLAVAVQVEDQTMSRIVERLERSGYVTRERDPQDRRRVVVSLTALGRRTAGRAGASDLALLRQQLIEVVRQLSSHRWPPAEGGVAS